MDELKVALYAAATVCQVAALFFTVAMMQAKRNRRPWFILFLAMLLMLLLRLLGVARGGAAPGPMMQLVGPVISFGISLFMFVSLFFIRQLSVAEQRSQATAQRRAIERDDALARLDAAMHAGKVGTWVWDVRNDRVVADEQFSEMFGLSPQDARAGTLDRFVAAIHPDDRPQPLASIRTALETGGPDYEAEYRIKCGTDGQGWTWIAARGRIERDTDGKPVRMIGVAVNIHDKKLAAEALERSLADERTARKEAELANRMKDEFLATLSHELRTPLNAIVGWAHLLKDDRDAETVREGMAVIERNSLSLTQLIADLLDMSRIISGKLRLDMSSVDLAGVIDAAVQTVAPAVSARQIQLERSIDRDLPLMSGDAARLQQVVWNLLSNAIKFTPAGGWVRVRLRAWEDQLELQVTDSGQGMTADFLPHVFERFHQADASTTRRHGGLGIGLSIVKHLVELHGGTVEAASAGADRGSTFVVRLPISAIVVRFDSVTDSPTRTNGRTPEFAEILKGLKILVVDDEADARELIRRMLENSLAIVSTAASGAEAMALMEREKPDVLISDIGMPDMDGYQLIRQVREQSALAGDRLPAIALTAFARSEDRTSALRAGYQLHVSKPVEPSELVASIASVAGRTAR